MNKKNFDTKINHGTVSYAVFCMVSGLD